MKEIRITYSNNILPFIQITFTGLLVNKYYIKEASSEFLKAILYSEGYDTVPDTLIEDIKAYSDLPDQEKDVTVVFTYT